MASPSSGEDKFTHDLAIKLSRALNLVNPNDLLARRVQDIAKTSSVDGFISGTKSPLLHFNYMLLMTCIAAKSFGKFKDSFLAELHSEITSHASQEASGLAPAPVQGIVVHDSEVLPPEPVRQGGLMRNDAVSDPGHVDRVLVQVLMLSLRRDIRSNGLQNP
jgi:pre-mRNA-splicing factor ATP-dependent RNA helicase DHX38/PRP16